jgi:hypothetical protein
VLGRFHTSSEGGSAGTEVLVGPSGSKSTLRFDEHGLVARQCANGTWELSRYDDQGRLEGRLGWKRASDGAVQGWGVRYEWTAEGDLVRVVDSLREVHQPINTTTGPSGTTTSTLGAISGSNYGAGRPRTP